MSSSSPASSSSPSRVGGFLAYDQVLRGDNVAPLALPSAAPGAGRLDRDSRHRRSGDPTAAPSAGAAASVAGSGATVTSPARGRWPTAARRATGSASSSPTCPPNPMPSGGRRCVRLDHGQWRAADGAQLTAELTVDTTSITSDKTQRDNRLRSEGLQTDQFPTATFMITQPVDIPAAAIERHGADVTLVGDLTLHGVTKSVEIPAQARLVDGQIQVAGSMPSRWPTTRSQPPTSVASSSRSPTRAPSSSSRSRQGLAGAGQPGRRHPATLWGRAYFV